MDVAVQWFKVAGWTDVRLPKDPACAGMTDKNADIQRLLRSQRPRGTAVTLAVALALASALDPVRRLASRAPQPKAAEEVPMFERSEFGHRADLGEERREPETAPSSPAPRPSRTVLVTFAKTKVTRATARKLLILMLLFIGVVAACRHR